MSETPIENPEEELERYRFEAKRAYDTLIQMGGRPTRPIRQTPLWTKVLVGAELWYRYAEQYEELFYDSWYGYTPGPNNSLTEAGFIRGHWFQERGRCNEELRRWQEFLDTQEKRRDQRPEFAREEDMERQRYPQDPQLTASLKRLKDWKEYQAYFRRGIDRLKRGMEGDRRAVEAIQRKDPDTDWSTGLGKFRGLYEEDWLDSLERRREKLSGEEKRLEWVKKQIPVVLSECAGSLMESSTSRRQMEERSELEAKQLYQNLIDTGGRPRRPIRMVPDVHNAEHTDEHLHVLCHWEEECSHFEEELREWKKLLDYRHKKETDIKTEVQLEGRKSVESPTQLDLWKDFQIFQHLEVEKTKQWVEFWARQVKECQDTEDHQTRQGWAGTAQRYHSKVERMKLHVEDARKQVRPAEMQLEWVEEQLSAIPVECAVSTTQLSTFDHMKDQAKPLRRASRSGQNTLKDLRSNQSRESALRSNDRKTKSRHLANPALGQIHSSKVSKASKAAERKTTRPRRQLKNPADYNDGQLQDLNKTISSTPPTSTAPRRSGRFHTNQNRSDVLEADLATDLGGDVQSQAVEVTPRRSNRILNQKEKVSTSSGAASNPAMILQTAPFPRSKRKGRVAGTKPDRSWEKPRGISKKLGRDSSRKRSKIPN